MWGRPDMGGEHSQVPREHTQLVHFILMGSMGPGASNPNALDYMPHEQIYQLVTSLFAA